MGDWADCILQSDKRWDIQGLAKWVEKDNIVESQRQRLVKLFKPIKSQIVCLLTGNHEESIHLRYQCDFTRNLCKDLGVTYGGYQCLIPVLFKRITESHQYVIHAWHGAGAAGSHGGRIQRLMRLVNEIEARIYLMGHLHATTVYRADRLALKSGRIKSQPIVACMTGSALKSYQQNSPTSYAERFGYVPSVIGFPTILINPQDDRITVEV